MRLTWGDEALDDLQRIFAFNSERSDHWATRVEVRLVGRALDLLNNPQLGRPLERAGVRRVSIADIQYVIDYEIGEDRVHVIGVQSTREIR